MSILRPAQLDKLRKKFGPDDSDGVCQVYRVPPPARQGAGFTRGPASISPKRQGAGFTAAGPTDRNEHTGDETVTSSGDTLLATLPCRVTYIGVLNEQERQIAAQYGHEGQFIISLPFDADVTGSDYLLLTGPVWQAEHRYFGGQVVIPTDDNGYRYQALGTGAKLSGTVEPQNVPEDEDDLELDRAVWLETYGALIVDGDVTWRNIGGYPRFEIIAAVHFTSYEVSQKLICKLQD